MLQRAAYGRETPPFRSFHFCNIIRLMSKLCCFVFPFPECVYPRGQQLDGTMACGKKSSVGLRALAPLGFVLTVQSKCWRRRKKNSPPPRRRRRSAVSAGSAHATPAGSQWRRYDLTDGGIRICLFKTANLLLQPLQKSKSLLRDCWAHAAHLFRRWEELFGKSVG